MRIEPSRTDAATASEDPSFGLNSALALDLLRAPAGKGYHGKMLWEVWENTASIDHEAAK